MKGLIIHSGTWVKVCFEDSRFSVCRDESGQICLTKRGLILYVTLFSQLIVWISYRLSTADFRQNLLVFFIL